MGDIRCGSKSPGRQLITQGSHTKRIPFVIDIFSSLNVWITGSYASFMHMEVIANRSKDAKNFIMWK